ncbi:hypothetical protein Hamer_G028471 [Homarus americanus]|uniref:Uncharacterized protein n=1 Tax=Homarus americanus TaxID=6706 RepID=A0A8J5JM65_HOMAM|nr:hypothetical protein Hamer_G028471 [Homarus americanus]
MQLVVKESKQLVVTDKKQVLTVPPRKGTANLAPCNHEEADTRMMVHAADALECGHRRILIRIVDTDVVILAVALANELSEVLGKLWLTFGTGKNRRYIAAHQIAMPLGPEKSRALPVSHAITGCDTVSPFAGHSKKAAWATWNAFPEVTTAFLSMASTPSELLDGVLSTLERFIVLLYDRTSTCCDVNVLRKKLLSRKSRSLEHLPSTRAALEQHIKSCLSGWTYLGTGRNDVCQSDNHVTGVRCSRVMSWNHSGPHFLKCQSHATSSSLAVAENTTVASVDAKKLHLNALDFVHTIEFTI